MLPQVQDQAYAPNDWYEADQAAMAKINAAAPFELIILHAGWCKDCQYHMPVWNKLCEGITNAGVKVTYSEVQREPRQDALGFCDKYNARNIPTWIVLRDGKELGRIVENPATSIEEDLAALV